MTRRTGRAAPPAERDRRAARRGADPSRHVFAQAPPPPAARPFPSDGKDAVGVRLGTGRILYNQGDTVPFFYLIDAGHLKLVRTSNGGDALIVDLLAPGSLFGPGLTTARRASHSAVAMGQVTLARYTPACLDRAVADDPVIATRLVNELADRLQGAERRLEAMLGLEVRTRVAIALRDLAIEGGTRCTHGHEIDVSITQQELAELVGASRPVVSLELNEMRRCGLLSYTRRFICLDRPDALLDWIGEGAADVSRRTDGAPRRR